MTIECRENEVKVWVNGDLRTMDLIALQKLNFQFRQKVQRWSFASWIFDHFK